jgi:hypothetical protein
MKAVEDWKVFPKRALDRPYGLNSKANSTFRTSTPFVIAIVEDA